MATIDVNINATLEIDDDTWYELLEAYDGNEEDALYELASDLESSNLDSMYGQAWACSADLGGWIDEPDEDRRPL